MIALPEINPVLAAALEAHLTPWYVIPTTTECPDQPSEMVESMVRFLSFSDDGQVPVGRVPFEVEVGDTLTARISNELPDDGAQLGDGYWVGYDDLEPIEGHLWLNRGTGLEFGAVELRPGCLLSVTVAANPDNTPAVLPIVARRHFYPTSTYEPGGGPWLGFDAGTFKGDPEELSLVRRRNGLFEWTDMSAELAWQDYTPDETQAVQVEGVEVTP